MYPLWPHVVAFASVFGTCVNLLGAVVLLSRITLKAMPKTGGPRYQAFRSALWHLALGLGRIESQI